MRISSNHFGHPVYLDIIKDNISQNKVNDDWRYEDTNEPAKGTIRRKCPKPQKVTILVYQIYQVLKMPVVDMGLKKGAYIHFEDDSVIRDEEAITYIKQLKNEI